MPEAPTTLLAEPGFNGYLAANHTRVSVRCGRVTWPWVPTRPHRSQTHV